MSLILCPECGTKISDKATTCPYCGFVSENSSLPISAQGEYEMAPCFQYNIEGWNPTTKELKMCSLEDSKRLFDFFGKFENIKFCIPELAEVIQKLAKKETYLVADIDNYVKDLIDKGIYHFTIDKNGDILPTIRDAKKIVKQVRLKNIEIPSDITQSMGHLRTQAILALVLSEIESVHSAIKEIHIEFQNDRLALAESSKEKLKQAFQIYDARLRESKIQEAIGSATDAKHMLMKNFRENLRKITAHSQKRTWEMTRDSIGQRIFMKDNYPDMASDAIQSLIAITNMVQLECTGYSLLGEYGAEKQCLLSFQRFITDNMLDSRDTLLRLNGCLEEKQSIIVDEFSLITKRIKEYDDAKELPDIIQLFIGGETGENETQSRKSEET